MAVTLVPRHATKTTAGNPAAPAARRRAALDLAGLALPGVGIVLLALWAAQPAALTDHPRLFATVLTGQLALYALAAWWAITRRPPARGALAMIFIVALAARLAFVAQAPTVSNDLYRYVWDGRVQAHNINPYLYAPDAPALNALRDAAIYPHVNRPTVHTIYPPVAQAAFRLIYVLHPDSLVWTKIALSLLDMVTIGVLAGLLLRLGLRPERVILYAWHPLLILEVGHSGHIDVVAILLLVLAVQARLAHRPIWTGVFLAAATLVKFYAVAALPALLRPDRRRDPRLPVAFAATALLAYLPFLNAGTSVLGYLSGYLQEEGITSGRRFYLLNQAERLAGWWSGGLAHWPARLPLSATQGYEALVVAALGGLALWCWLRPLSRVPACGSRAIAGRVVVLFAVLLVLTTPAYPWYTLLALACAPLAGRRALLLAATLTSSAGYLYLQWWLPGTPQWPLTLAYGGGALALLLVSGRAAWAWLARRRAQTPDPGGAASNEPPSLFDRFPWLYALCRNWLFRDHSARIARALWPDGTPESGSELIELGCGPGHYARHFAARYAGLRVTGIDRSPQQLRYARSRAAARRLGNCRFVEDDALALRRRANSADVIVASRLFTILPERERAVREMHRVLRPGGRCFIAEPRSTVFTAIPLRALWLLAGLTALWRGERTVYREPHRATILTSAEFGALLATQPWVVRHWADRQYHFAVCEKVADIVALAAD